MAPSHSAQETEAAASALCFAHHPQDGRGNGYPHYSKATQEAWRRVARWHLAELFRVRMEYEEFLGAEREILAETQDALDRQREAFIDYLLWLNETLHGVYGLAYAHGHKFTAEQIAEGERRRALLGIDIDAEKARRKAEPEASTSSPGVAGRGEGR